MISQEYFQVSQEALNSYAKAADRTFKTQSATEVSYYDSFKRFLESIFPISKGYLVQIGQRLLNSPNHPDITVSYKNIILFHVEAKKPQVPLENLLKYSSKDRLYDQIQRYTNGGVQLLITDFTRVLSIKPPSNVMDSKDPEIISNCILLEMQDQHLRPVPDAITQFQILLARTCESRLQTISNVKRLIHPLADIAKGIRTLVLDILGISYSSEISTSMKITAARYLEAIRDDFQKSIFHEEIADKSRLFADLFAQTIVYGAFSAWVKYCQHGNRWDKFSIQTIGDFLPYGSFLRDLFLDLRAKIPSDFHPLLEEMEHRFRKTEYTAIMENVETLITTFYSDFLAEYDPQTAKDRGVVYTPHEIVEYMIHGIDFMLNRWLNIPDGIIKRDIVSSSNYSELKENQKINRLRILDPAAGTMAFACGLLHVAKTKFDQKFSQSTIATAAFSDWVTREFFQNMYAFEILMAPYVLGHIRTFLTLESLGLNLNAEEHHLNSYLMNTLMTPPNSRSMDEWLFNNQEIGREVNEALDIRDKRDIFVIMGNPPYNLSSQNNCKWINEKVMDYKVGLTEKNQKILADDYVKFLRFAQWKIEQVGTGILAFITNNRYLDGQMFSVMRKSLRSSFDRIYIINLHGDMRKKENGNPFDIRVGVCISIMVRIDNTQNKQGSVYYMDVPDSSREEKFNRLAEGFQENKFVLLSETRQNYFVPISTELLNHYEGFTSIDQIFANPPMSGIMIGRDRLLVDVDRDNVLNNMELFFSHQDEILEQLGISLKQTKTWEKETARKSTELKTVQEQVRRILYRGWDYRYIIYSRALVEGHRMGYIDQISGINPALTITKSSRKKVFETALVVHDLIEKCFMSVTDTAYAFPVTLNGKSNILIPRSPFSITDRELFAYIYAILYSPTYRQRYDEYLRKEFPRIPIINDEGLFRALSQVGEKLIRIHLDDIEISSHLTISDTPPNEWIVREFIYNPKENCLYFDHPQKKLLNTPIPWIKGITSEMWNYSIGTIPQMEQFLSSRKYSSTRKWNTLQRSLSPEELLGFLRLNSRIAASITLFPQIDEIYKQIDKIEDDEVDGFL